MIPKILSHNIIPKIALRSKIHYIYKSGLQTTDQLIVRGIIRQISYISQDIKRSHFSRVAHPEERQRAYENLRLLIFNNLPKHLIVTMVCLIIPIFWFPGSTGVSRYIIHNNPILRKYMKLKFQKRERKFQELEQTHSQDDAP